MLADGLVNLPSAPQSCTELDQISSTKTNGFSLFWSHRHIAFKDETALAFLVLPGERAGFTTPDRPLTNTEFPNQLLRAGADDLNQDVQLASATVTVSRSSPELYISIMMSEPPRNSPLR